MRSDAAAPLQHATGLLRATLLAQGAYFVGTGVWGNVHPGSFQLITGPKHDYWLVRVVGALVLVIGLVLGRSGLRDERPRGDIVALATGSAAVLGALEAYYAAKRRISLVYLADGVVEGALLALGLYGWLHPRRWPTRRGSD